MRTPAKLAAFSVALAVLFGGGALAGGAIDPDRKTSTTVEHAGSESGAPHQSAHPVRGLSVVEDGLRLEVDNPELRLGRAQIVRFRIVDESGETVRDFDVAHEKRMHLIVARRDLSAFQHLHPEQAGDGSWSVKIALAAAGSYRMFADFARDAEPVTLATDLRVDGDADLKPLPNPRGESVSDGGYDVHLDSSVAGPGEEARLSFTITRADRAVRTEPYLGAGGHLVALREGDLAFLHVHPTEQGHDEGSPGAHAQAGRDDSIGFAATFPSVGNYRLFLQFKHEGRVQTVAFTQEVK